LASFIHNLLSVDANHNLLDHNKTNGEGNTYCLQGKTRSQTGKTHSAIGAGKHICKESQSGEISHNIKNGTKTLPPASPRLRLHKDNTMTTVTTATQKQEEAGRVSQ
jgi:hypothetical protein